MTILLVLVSLFIGLRWHDNLLLLPIITLGWLIFVLWRFSKKSMIIASVVLISGILYGNVPIPYDKTATSFEGIVVASKENYFIYQSGLSKYYLYEKNNTREVGDFLSVSGTCSSYHFSVIESQLDFNVYLKNKGVDLQIYATKITPRFLVPLRKKIIVQKFTMVFNEETRVIVDSLLFGETDYDAAIIRDAKSMQVMHLVSLSGIHLNLLLIMMVYLLGLLVPDKWSKPLTIVVLLPYLVLIITKIASIRVIGTFVLKYCNDTFWKKKFGYVGLISMLGVICLLFSRYIVFDNGFVLTFLIPLVLLFSRNAFSMINKRKKNIFIPLFIFLFFIPVMSSFNYELNFLSYFTQILFLPILFIVYLTSLFSLYTLPLVEFMNFFGKSIATSFSFISELNLTVLTGVPVPLISFLFYLGYLLCLLGIETKRKAKSELGITVILASVVISILPLKIALTNSIVFINVGQGDSILIREGQNTVLIDTGGSINYDIALECLIPYFKKEKISKIDYLITTHDDYDHSGGKESLMTNFRVKNYVNEISAFPLQFGTLNFVNLNTFGSVQGDNNDSSFVLYLEFLHRKWLFTGDASTIIENKIIKENPNLDVDVLKVGHHGSDSSTSDLFLQTIDPDEAIISVGKNMYGHPTTKVLERLAKYGIRVRRTDFEGTISYTEWSF